MRIIENPNPVEEKIVTCEKCQCKYAYCDGDIMTESWNNGVFGIGFSAYKKEWVTCPNCGERHMIRLYS